jgi:transposase
MNTKLHAVTDSQGRPIRFFITAVQVSDYVGAGAIRVPAGGRLADRRPGLQRRLVQGRVE